MKKILAVSGGVDSVVMLDMMRDDPDVVVAHFNHGIRGNSDEDEFFVRKLASEYGLPFQTEKENLREKCSEAMAREKRYAFLRRVAQEYNGEIYTAHHSDDLVESVIINLLRGTGWRGLSPMMGEGVVRPLLMWDKARVHRYAAERGLRWRQDPTNTEDSYLRNRVRELFGMTRRQDGEEKFMMVVDLAMRQREIGKEISQVIVDILPDDSIFCRQWFREMEDGVAIEILRAALLRVGKTATRPQLAGFLLAIREYAAGKSFNLPDDVLVRFSKDEFVLE
ncbi:MAG: tRNA lysidine(34) synthetase TilS [Candidatus Nomurabacteria bacterium]|jgi:tRNA(Ile)-lysidine synthetase-like protein|nr:tRNA lysidine(34) synthetase TilS [Candidatus Nomurabacteria bacterium]